MSEAIDTAAWKNYITISAMLVLCIAMACGSEQIAFS